MKDLNAAWTKVRGHAAGCPEAYEESPWGELAAKVRKKIFVFLGPEPGPKLSFSLKLPESRDAALAMEQATPTGYGLGRHGWVSFAFHDGEDVPIDQVVAWVDESFRAVAPKTLVRRLHERTEATPDRVEPILAGTRILLVGDDPLRLERARQALVARAADVVEAGLAEALDAAGQGDPDAIVVDLSRNARKGTTLLGDLGLVASGAIFVAGVRSARMEASVKDHAGLAWVSREPPGDPTFVRGLEERLGT